MFSAYNHGGQMRSAHRENANTGERRAIIFLAGSVALACALTLASVAVAAPANGQRAEPPKPSSAMRVVIVTDSRAGCEPGCAQWIAAHGEITKDTPAQFQRVFKALGQKRVPIFISSPGGAVSAALAIGREIRKRRLDVAVERTIFQKCEHTSTRCDPRALSDAEKGRPEPVGALCASACVLILAAGTTRGARLRLCRRSPAPRVAVHAEGVADLSGPANDRELAVRGTAQADRGKAALLHDGRAES
jgi:hypothetical protein